MSTPRVDEPVAFGKYILTERLGRGGMAEVWKAKILGPAGFQRTLVVKRILPHLVEDDHFVQMFVAEARLSARLNHANIVQVFELGDCDGEYFIAMEYVRGRDLVSTVRAQMARGEAPIPGLGAFVIREICRALGYAHAFVDENGTPLRLIHRDVSPSNVMISFDGAVKLLDFGIAKALAEATENKTQTGTLKGKFGYMAPEQVEGKDIDNRSDLFAAGVVLHEVLTGRRLFKGTSDLQTLAMVRDAKIDPPSKFNPAVPPELDRIVLKALAKDLNVRYRTCEEMAADLDEVVHSLKWGPEKMAVTMRELFPEDPTHTGLNTTLAADMNDLSFRSRSMSSPIARNAQRVRRNRILYIVGGAATALGIGLASMSRHHDVPPRVPLAHETAVREPVKVVEPPPLSENIFVDVQSLPVGAEVRLGDDKTSRGVTPLKLKVKRDIKPVELVFSLRGYEPSRLQIIPTQDQPAAVSLAKMSPLASAPKVPAKPKKPVVARKKSGVSKPLGDGTVDPFAE